MDLVYKQCFRIEYCGIEAYNVTKRFIIDMDCRSSVPVIESTGSVIVSVHASLLSA